MSDEPIIVPIEPVTALAVRMPEAQQLLGIGKTKLADLCRTGDLDRLHIGRRAVVTVESIRRYLNSLRVG